MLLAGGLGALVGTVLGLTGAGGGILAVPALVLGLGFAMAQANPVALVAVALAAMLGALDGLRKGLVRYKAAALMAVFGSLSAPIGIVIGRAANEAWLMSVFSAVMFLVAWRMYRQGRFQADVAGASDTMAAHPKPCQVSPATGRFVWNFKTFATLASIGVSSGIMTGMLGVGGGFIIVPALRQFSNVSMHGIVATSLMVVALVSGTTVATAVWAGARIPELAWPFIAFATFGMLVGRSATSHVSTSLLQRIFGVVAALVAVLMLTKTYTGLLA